MGIVWITYEKYMALINLIPTIKNSSIGRLCQQRIGGSEIPTQVLQEVGSIFTMCSVQIHTHCDIV